MSFTGLSSHMLHFLLKRQHVASKGRPPDQGTLQLFLLKISTSRPGFNFITIKHERFILQEKQTNMEKQRAWSTPGTFSLPFLHDWLFGGKGHRKEYNPFFTFSDSLKCLTRKTASSTPHSSLQPELIYSVNRGQDTCGHLSPDPHCTPQPHRAAQPHRIGMKHQAQAPKLFLSTFLALTPSKKNVPVPPINLTRRRTRAVHSTGHHKSVSERNTNLQDGLLPHRNIWEKLFL